MNFTRILSENSERGFLPGNRFLSREVLDGGSPLPLWGTPEPAKSGRGLPQSKALSRFSWAIARTGCRATLVMLILLWFLVQPMIAATAFRPSPGRGGGATTLVLFTETRSGYALENSLELLKVRLQRVNTHVEAIPLRQAGSNQIASADYLVVFCPNAHPDLSTNVLEAVAATNKPVLWIGYGPDQIAKTKPFEGQFVAEPFLHLGPTSDVGYRERRWFAPVAPLAEARLTTQSVARVLMTLHYTASNAPAPLCWQSQGVTFFAAVPDGGRLGQLFSDLLLDFYAVTTVPSSAVFLRIDDYQCASDHREFQRKVDFLASRSKPFLVSVTPTCSGNGGSGDLEANPDYVAGLRYAQARGGRIVLRGFAPDAAGYEFWDAQLDRPLAKDTPEFTRERLHQGVRQLLKQGLLPLGWQTPHYAASRTAQREIARVFSTGVERVQLSDASERDAFAPDAVTLNPGGMLIVPENLGFVVANETNAVENIQMSATNLLQTRGTVGGCVIHAYQPLATFMTLVERLEALQVPFLDLADLDNTVRLPGGLLITANAERKVTLVENSVLRWKAFTRAGQLLSEGSETVGGERVLRRRGQGDYELYEFTEGTP